MRNNTASTLALAAAFAGLLGGTTARLHAQSVSGHSNTPASASANAGVMVAQATPDVAKHSRKGKHSCKGKNSCKGKGACATDGSKPSNS